MVDESVLASTRGKIDGGQCSAIAILLFLWMALGIAGCAGTSPKEKYLQDHPNLSPEKIVALRHNTIINGMSIAEVELALGKPRFIEEKEKGEKRWVYRDAPAGVKQKDAYDSGSYFATGIGFVIPLHYRSREIRIDFSEGTVCQVENVLSF